MWCALIFCAALEKLWWIMFLFVQTSWRDDMLGRYHSHMINWSSMSRNVGLGMIVCLETVWLVFDCVWMLYSCTSRWFSIHGCCLTVYVETVLLQDCVCVLYGCCVMGYFIRNIILSPPRRACLGLCIVCSICLCLFVLCVYDCVCVVWLLCDGIFYTKHYTVSA